MTTLRQRLTDPVSGRSTTFAYAPSPDCAERPPIPDAPGIGAAPAGMLCRIDYWDGTSSELYYARGLLATGSHDFYGRLGWVPWRGRLAVREPDGRVTPTPRSPPASAAGTPRSNGPCSTSR